jgi:hypothetical protein
VESGGEVLRKRGATKPPPLFLTIASDCAIFARRLPYGPKRARRTAKAKKSQTLVNASSSSHAQSKPPESLRICALMPTAGTPKASAPHTSRSQPASTARRKQALSSGESP